MPYSVVDAIPDYQNFIESMGDIVYMVDRRGNITFVNNAFEKLLGYSKEEIISRPIRGILMNGGKEIVTEWYGRYLQQKEEDKFLVHFTARDGRIVIVEINAVPIYEKGEIIGFHGIGRDMTDRIRKEGELKKKTRELETLYTISNLINQSCELENVLNRCLEEISKFFNTKVSFIRVFDTEQGTTRLIAYRGLSSKYLEAENSSPLKLSESIIYQMLKAGKSIIISDYQKSSFPCRKRLLAEGIKSAVFVPMRAREKLLGGIVLGSTRYNAFSIKAMDFLETIGIHIGMAFENIQYYREILKNISELKKKENEIRAARDFLENILNNTLDGIIVTDMDGTITFFNYGTQNLTGYGPSELMGCKICQLFDRGKEEAQKMMNVLLEENKLANYELDVIGKDDHLVPLLISASLLRDKQGNVKGMVGVAKDLTEKRQWENQILLTEKLASIGKLAAGAGHEILNPMQIILGAVQFLLLMKESLDQKMIQRLRLIEDQVHRVVEVVDGLIRFANEPTTIKSNIDMNEIVDKTSSLVKRDFYSNGIEVIKRPSPSPLVVYANADELGQVVLNLLINANEAMPKGGKIIINSGLTKLRNRTWVSVAIIDSGIGISPEDLPHIFDPFFTTKEVGKGTGLGLSVCYGIIKRHGGFIKVESQVGEGSTFTLHLPLPPPKEAGRGKIKDDEGKDCYKN